MKRTCTISLFLVLVFPAAFAQHPAFAERVEDREAMVQEVEHYSSIRISDKKVIDALRKVPRHAFVPVELQDYAYINRPLPIGHEQTISQPVIVASMTDMLDLEGHEKVLEIGTGSGYQAAILAELCREVFSIEIVEPLGLKAAQTLDALGYGNVEVKIGDGHKGWKAHAPFDRIIVTAAPEDVPQTLKDQLAIGGRMVIPVGKTNGLQYLVVLTKNRDGKITQKIQYPVRFVPMTGEAEQ